MVAHLHPRSRSTLSLFTSCLAISFLVVGAPHVLPCPVDRRQFAEDGTGEPRKRRRRKAAVDSETDRPSDFTNETAVQDMGLARECPIPKPGGLLGQVMGFKDQEKETPTVIVKSLRDKRRSEEASS